jgi:FixJ family two-component response regulator
MMKPVEQGKGRRVSDEPLVAVIDDDDPFRAALVESLISLGYETRDFSSAEEFIALGGETAWGCVITDIHMRGMSGFDIKRLLMERDPRLPVIMITARADPGLEAKAAASGAICLLRKPFESSELINCLDRALLRN